jgi:hypothetical protein
MKNILKIITSILLLLCLLNMPYGYYQLVRLVSFASFLVIANISHKEEQNNLMYLFIFFAILFQPFIKVALGRQIWNIVDVVVAVILLGSIFYKEKN